MTVFHLTEGDLANAIKAVAKLARNKPEASQSALLNEAMSVAMGNGNDWSGARAKSEISSRNMTKASKAFLGSDADISIFAGTPHASTSFNVNDLPVWPFLAEGADPDDTEAMRDALDAAEHFLWDSISEIRDAMIEAGNRQIDDLIAQQYGDAPDNEDIDVLGSFYSDHPGAAWQKYLIMRLADGAYLQLKQSSHSWTMDRTSAKTHSHDDIAKLIIPEGYALIEK